MKLKFGDIQWAMAYDRQIDKMLALVGIMRRPTLLLYEYLVI